MSHKISIHLAKLFNISIQEQVFPDILKIAKVTPIPKAGDLQLLANFRPISQTDTKCKIFEYIIYKQLNSFLEENKLISKFQFGFRKHRSTEDSILSLTEKNYYHLNCKETSVLISLDLQKAFDVINRDILTYKLENLGIRGDALKWFKSYLSNRKQYVKLKSFSSDILTVSHGVPQGSVLGPVLFSIYINDFDSCHDAYSVRFADDTSIIISSKDINELKYKVTMEVTKNFEMAGSK